MKADFSKNVQEEPIASKEQTPNFMQYINLFSAIMTDSLYVLDIQKEQFCYIKPDNLFLCGFSVEDALKLGYNFYSKIICSEDLHLWADVRKAIVQYLINFEDKKDNIDYFFCTFRLQRSYSFFMPRLLQQMVHHYIKPVWENNELRYFICSVGSSTVKKSGNLRMYSKDVLIYEEYNLKTKRWKQKTKEFLTEREQAILMLAQQGKNSKEIADYLYRGHNTIRNQIKPLFSKLNVHSIKEAIELTNNHHILYTMKSGITKINTDSNERSFFYTDSVTDEIFQDDG